MSTHEIIGKSDSIRKVVNLMQRVAECDGTVLITGETGTGKELVARGIHNSSARSRGRLVCCNCSAIPDTLLESELFGYEKGAFTGAAAQKRGMLTEAHQGTLFLDEVGEMSALSQAKVLRALEIGEVQPLGACAPHRTDARVIAATHRDLPDMVSQNLFRRDLFFRLNVIPIHIPPLRKRREDISELARHFVQKLNGTFAHRHYVEGVSPEGMRFLCEQDWPGNVRQLRNVIEAAFLIAAGPWITQADLLELHWNTSSVWKTEVVACSDIIPHTKLQSDPERLLDALEATSWNKTKAATLLRWSRMTVYRKIAKYRLHTETVGNPPEQPEDPRHRQGNRYAV